MILVYLLGIITGLVLALIWILLSVIMPYKPSKLIETIQTSTKLRQKGEVLIPKDEATETRERLIKEKQDAGLDIYLDELS